MIFINSHEIVLDKEEKLQSWTEYGRVVDLAMSFIKQCPVDSRNELPWYLQYSCFWTDPLRPVDWPDNPAGKFAWAVTTLLKYYPYCGEDGFIKIVAEMLDRLWEYRTPADYFWGNVPYATAHPGTGIYYGARADGEYVTEPDKIAQVGKAFLDFYKLTSQVRFLDMAEHCANVLSARLRPGDDQHSPLPFRVDVRTGDVVEEYSAHMIAAVRLFDDLIAYGMTGFQSARDQVWNWICEFPLKNHIWKGYFEDIRLDPENGNRDQLSALETARYFLEHKEDYEDWKTVVASIIAWVRDILGSEPFFAAVPIHEQKYCYYWMGSHTARFASICARYWECTGDQAYREIAERSFNWASYMACEDGTVTVGVDRPDYYNQCWFTDGYFDYVPHFVDGMASLPELAPAGEDHMLRSSSVVQQISYNRKKIKYRTFDQNSLQRFRLTFQPDRILAEGELLPLREELDERPGWKKGEVPGVIDIQSGAREVLIQG